MMADEEEKNSTVTSAGRATATTGQDQASLFHVLMLPDGKTIDSRRKVDENLQHDYLGKRYEAYKALKQGKEREDDPVWSGASTTEKWLIWCCEMPEISGVEQPEFTLPGSLRRDRVLKFVGYLALYCHDVISRALAISILERTLEADLPAMEAHEAAEQAAQKTTISMGAPISSNIKTELEAKREVGPAAEGSPSTRNRKRMLESSSPSPTPEETSTTETVLPRKPDRLWQFLAAGGLKILDQWIDDASRPVTGPKAPPKSTKSAAANTKESPTGALLLPLLMLLRNLPFDKKLVKQTKINRQIRKLSKDIDVIAESKKSKKMTHPRAGGSPVVQVQEALDDLKTNWNAQQKQKSTSEPPPDPFFAVNEALEQRLQEIEDYQAGKAAQPAWLATAFDEAPPRKPSPVKKPRPMSTEEMNRIDHQNERNRLLKDDLQKAEQERRDFHKRLREIKRKHAEQAKQAKAEAEVESLTSSTRRRRVKWLDGGTFSSQSHKRENLEQVFVFIKNTSAAEGLVTEEEEADMIVEENADVL